MNQRWRKLGRLYIPHGENRHPKLGSHAANPLPVHLEGDVYRIFYSGRDERNRSSVGAVDIDVIQRTIVRDHHEPIFVHGAPGSFYADGVSIGNSYRVGGQRYILFMGWQAPSDGHWRGDVGRLALAPDLSLSLVGNGPYMASDNTDPLSLSYPWVLEEEDGTYRMWYGSTLTWNTGKGEMLHVIHGASSRDGMDWVKTGLAVPYALGIAQAFSRPTVVKRRTGLYQMWFSYRSGSGEKYRIGYASSSDGANWKLELEHGGIDVSVEGWDSEMIEYPFVFEHKDRLYMLYNGNGYGKSGFGLAVLEDDETVSD